jgi:glutamate synthase (NADPH/NADH) large chain
VVLGLSALRRVAHRGTPATLGAVDGCGVMTAIPWQLVPAGQALGMVFVDPAQCLRAEDLFERELRAAGARTLQWRRVPTDPAAVLPAQRSTTPVVLQVVAGFDSTRKQVDEALYRARLRIERIAREQALRASIASLSTRTVVYKGLVTPDALTQFYPDLSDARFASTFIVFHQRFSTNTSADWALAQPFRVVAHNGEINTIGGNRSWMRARTADATSLPGIEGDTPVAADGSDSRSLDDAVELLAAHGYSLPHALARLMPSAWEADDEARAILRRDRHLSGFHRVAPHPVAGAAFTESVRAVNE